MEAQRCVELTGTNRSIGLIALINRCPPRDATASSDPRDATASSDGRHDLKDQSDQGTPDPSPGCVPPIAVCFRSPFAGLVTFAQRQDPIPSRTRPSNAEAPMVLCLKTWESRSLPGLPRANVPSHHHRPIAGPHTCPDTGHDAGWSSPVARQAHNLKAAGSNPAPATKYARHQSRPRETRAAFFVRGKSRARDVPADHGRMTNTVAIPCGVILKVRWCPVTSGRMRTLVPGSPVAPRNDVQG